LQQPGISQLPGTQPNVTSAQVQVHVPPPQLQVQTDFSQGNGSKQESVFSQGNGSKKESTVKESKEENTLQGQPPDSELPNPQVKRSLFSGDDTVTNADIDIDMIELMIKRKVPLTESQIKQYQQHKIAKLKVELSTPKKKVGRPKKVKETPKKPESPNKPELEVKSEPEKVKIKPAVVPEAKHEPKQENEPKRQTQKRVPTKASLKKEPRKEEMFEDDFEEFGCPEFDDEYESVTNESDTLKVKMKFKKSQLKSPLSELEKQMKSEEEVDKAKGKGRGRGRPRKNPATPDTEQKPKKVTAAKRKKSIESDENIPQLKRQKVSKKLKPKDLMTVRILKSQYEDIFKSR
jgi:carbon monoxide dehydrogenase subunit G